MQTIVERRSGAVVGVLLAIVLGFFGGCAATRPAPGPAGAEGSPAPPRAVWSGGPGAGAPAGDDSLRRTGAADDADRQPPSIAEAGDLGPVPAPDVIPPGRDVFPIDLATSLRLASAENPTIAAAQAQVLEALALRLGADTLLLPSLNAGANYHGHDGALQRSSGRILRVSEQSLYVGGGARTLAAESVAIPAVNIASPLADAFFEPLVARRRVAAAERNVAATSNEILRDVALAHVDLVAAGATLDAQRLAESQTADVLKITRDFAEAGEGREADADRAATDQRLRRLEVLRAEEETVVASARLAELLNLDPSVRLRPASPTLVPFDLISLDVPTRELIDEALRLRPDLGVRDELLAQSEVRLHQELARPWLPTLWLGFSGGGFGGGSNLVQPLLGNFAGRTDFDVRLYWTLLNLGGGNLSLQNRRRAEVGQALGERSRVVNLARREVASARAEGLAARGRIEAARRALASAEDGFRKDLARSRDNLVRPIEVLNSVNLLAGARVDLIRAVADYDRQQLRLFVALGSPPPPPPAGPLIRDDPPVTIPLRSPFVDCGED